MKAIHRTGWTLVVLVIGLALAGVHGLLPGDTRAPESDWSQAGSPRPGNSSGRASTEDRPENLVTEVVEAPPAGHSLGYSFRPGLVIRYSFQYRQSTGALVSKEAFQDLCGPDVEVRVSEGRGVELECTGDWIVTAYSNDHDQTLVGLRVSNLSMEVDIPGRSLEAQELEETARAAEGEEVLSKVSRTGEFQDLDLEGIPARSADFLSTLLSHFRIILPGDSRSEWSAIEADSLGEYEGRYAVLGSPFEEEVTIEKARLYASIRGASGENPLERAILLSSSRAVFRRTNGLLAEVESRETVNAPAEGTSFGVESRSLARFLLVSVSRGERVPAPRRTPQDRKSGTAPAEDPFLDLASAIAEAEGTLAISGGLSPEERARLLDRVAALARTPGIPRRVLDVVLGLDPSLLPLAELLLDALARAATPEAAGALVEVATDNAASTEFRESALFAVVMADEQPDDLVARLLVLARRGGGDHALRGTLSQALGIAASRARERGDRRSADRARSYLEEALESPAARDREEALYGLGNLGDPRSFERIVPLTRDPDSATRAAAALALRKMPIDRALGVLQPIFLEDPSPEVRDAAGEAIENPR